MVMRLSYFSAIIGMDPGIDRHARPGTLLQRRNTEDLLATRQFEKRTSFREKIATKADKVISSDSNPLEINLIFQWIASLKVDFILIFRRLFMTVYEIHVPLET